MARGRLPSIPMAVWTDVFTLHQQGLGCRKIANWLMGQGISTSWGSVYWLLNHMPPYALTGDEGLQT